MSYTDENNVNTEATTAVEPTTSTTEAADISELIKTSETDPEGSTTQRKERRKETKPRVRLTEDQALEIIKAYDKGNGTSQKDLAVQYGVTQGAISHIATGKRWAQLKKVKPSDEGAVSDVDTTPAPTTSEADA